MVDDKWISDDKLEPPQGALYWVQDVLNSLVAEYTIWKMDETSILLNKKDKAFTATKLNPNPRFMPYEGIKKILEALGWKEV